MNELGEITDKIVQLLQYDPVSPLIFSSGLFLFLFGGFTFFYQFMRREVMLRIVYVTLFSLYFYYKTSGFFFLLLIAVSVSDFLIGKGIARSDRQGLRKGLLALSVALDIGLLIYFKYTNFFIGIVNGLSGHHWLDFQNIFLPVGISFFVFQSISYTADIYRRRIEPLGMWIDYIFFLSFFPQLVQGPISRYDALSQTLYKEHSLDWNNIRFGLQRILWGFFKKLLVADRLVVAVKALVGSPEEYTGAYVVLAVFFYAIQLYADFTGGIDITIGIAEVFGIRVTENFIRPYFSKNINEYWTRWHITMGTWFKDYIFYPISVCGWMLKLSKWSREKLGKEAGKRVPVYLANIVVWFTTGLWHGASWNFIVWGMLNCVVTLVSYELEPLYARFHEKVPAASGRWYDGFQAIRTFWIMGFIRILDCYRDVPLTFHQVGTVFTTGNWGSMFTGISALGLGAADYGVILFGAVMMFLVSLKGRSGSVRKQLAEKSVPVQVIVWFLLFFSILILGAYGVGYDSNQFIYNQF